MLANISANLQPKRNTPNFEGCKIHEPIRQLKILGKSSEFYLIPRDATNQEAKTALESIKELLNRPFEKANRKLYSNGASYTVINTQEGDCLELTQTQDKNYLKRMVYGTDNMTIEKLEIDDADGELSVNNTNLLHKVVEEILKKVKDVSIEQRK